MSGYQAWTILGIVLATLVARLAPAPSPLAPRQRTRIALAAVIGAVLGAVLLQLPADLLGWSAPHGAGDARPLGGRTVLGGLIGGWLTVEAAKRALGVRSATGDAFALPLAVALCCGRLGCWCAGCCAGAPLDDGWRAGCAVLHDDGTRRVPVQLIEAGFHAGAALLLWAAQRRDLLAGRRLAAYLTVYAALRFVLEPLRESPRPLLGLSWYQWLALALGLLAGLTWWRRTILWKAAASQNPPR